VVIENYKKNYPDFSLGVMAKNNKELIFGISVSHLTRPHDATGDVDVSRLPLKYTAFVRGRINPDDAFLAPGFIAEPAIMYSYQRNNNELIWGSQFTIGSYFQTGAWVRQNTRFNFESLIVTVGLAYEKYNIGYSYDVNLKKINFLSTKMGAHEVTFLYRFEYKEGKRKKIICPAY